MMTEEKMKLGKELDSALHYTAYNLRKTGHNTKPVLFHSFKVAYKLYQYGYSEEVVIAAALHDLLEDTSVTKEDIKIKFGESIANIVSVVSFDSNIKDKLEQARIMFQNCIDYGIEAVILKCADLIDNIDYVSFVKDKEKYDILLAKYKLFLSMSEKLIGKTEIYKELETKVKDKEEKI